MWPEIEAITERGLAAVAMTPSHSWVAPAGGTKPALGNKSIRLRVAARQGQSLCFRFRHNHGGSWRYRPTQY
ncbi:hypothetical protein [Mesorhizobium waimense]|uniref:hypothetical protein n=1 Tax=Mesorhizobium waimense TaxID=1300307 RepID=UPI003CCB6C67